MSHRVCNTTSTGMQPRDRRVSFEFIFDDSAEALTNGIAASLSLDRQRLHEQLKVHREVDEKYLEWQEHYPHAIRSFEEIEAKIKDKRIALFLDYDGTLTPIVRNPDQAFMSDEMRKTVRQIAKSFPTAIISGRGRDKVQRFVMLEELYYAGSHGLDIKSPKRSIHELPDVTTHQPAAGFEPLINTVYDRLKEAVNEIKGAHVEHNKFCLSVHFRNCEKEGVEELEMIVKDLLRHYEDSLKITTGRKVIEVRPKLEWDKGKAVEHLLNGLKLNNDDVVPIYLGDDKTDEDAFKFLRRRGNGLGILVSSKVKSTDASFSLIDTQDVLIFLQQLISWDLMTTMRSGNNITTNTAVTRHHRC
eukprot:g3088.t1